MTVHHSFSQGDENAPFYGQADTQGEVARAAEEVYAIVRRLKSPGSALAVAGMIRKMLLAEVSATLSEPMLELLLLQDAKVLEQFEVVAAPHPKGDA